MKETALVIMAAGIGSRFGGGIKQLQKVGPSGEIIMDYSIYDALRAGFDRVVFIIRKDIEEDFKEIIGKRIEKVTKVDYVYQDLNDLPEGFTLPEGRKKPWGTGHAVLAARKVIDCPFAVINADDFYGAESFKIVHDYLVSDRREGYPLDLCMAGFVLKNTLSENGAVTRGVCSEDEDHNLLTVTETFEIRKGEDGVVTGRTEAGEPVTLSADGLVSMNMWGLTEEVVSELEKHFVEFLENLKEGDIKAEYLLPGIVDGLIQTGQATVKVLPTYDKWYGMTYKEDVDYVKESIAALVKNGTYKEALFD